MKNFALLSFLFILLASEVRVSRADASPDAVRDIDGKKLRAGVNYYILPVFRGRGGGLALGNLQSDKCPLNVVQEQFELMNGLPAAFLPVNPKKGVVRVSTDLNVQFEASTICATSTVWKLDKFDESTKQWFITIGGARGNPGVKTVDNWFKIEKHGNDYKFKFCPTVCDFCKVMCRDVGIFFKNGKRALALSDTPFPVMFKVV
ncbi:kunitz trypsin inhibitor 2 [Cucurbita pepo subsp. pepo]|uniref:kunitz trypsin inhibitor 2 n=1 Tax=Cucurbita pepo subsp. pepo TaxID=3664 RepID=UPI000C9D5E03|nr:kunitz trypsin inhibitor 2 [Cucurbita pepo subsp. pepo]